MKKTKLIPSKILSKSEGPEHLCLQLFLPGLCNEQPWTDYHMIRMHQVSRVSAFPPCSSPTHYVCRSVMQMWLLYRDIPQRWRRLWLLQIHLVHDYNPPAHSNKEEQFKKVFLDIHHIFQCMNCRILLNEACLHVWLYSNAVASCIFNAKATSEAIIH